MIVGGIKILENAGQKTQNLVGKKKDEESKDSKPVIDVEESDEEDDEEWMSPRFLKSMIESTPRP